MCGFVRGLGGYAATENFLGRLLAFGVLWPPALFFFACCFPTGGGMGTAALGILWTCRRARGARGSLPQSRLLAAQGPTQFRNVPNRDHAILLQICGPYILCGRKRQARKVGGAHQQQQRNARRRKCTNAKSTGNVSGSTPAQVTGTS